MRRALKISSWRVRADVIYLANELFAGTKIMSVSALCICPPPPPLSQTHRQDQLSVLALNTQANPQQYSVKSHSNLVDVSQDDVEIHVCEF